MIIFKNCTEASMDEIFSAFSSGFSDYIIKIEMPKEAFENRFFGPEGNQLQYSYIAMDDKLPVGLILGGIRVFDGIKTMRCGTLCIHPDYRKQGISQRIFQLHKKCAMENGCRQLFLEVIAGNEKAINFYIKQGYEKIYDLHYFSCSKPFEAIRELNANFEISDISLNVLREIRNEIPDIHVNWQNDIDYIEKVHGQRTLGMFIGANLVGAISGSERGTINFIYIKPEYRIKGLGRKLVAYYAGELQTPKMVICIPNNSKLAGFLKRINFSKDNIKQYEMYLNI